MANLSLCGYYNGLPIINKTNNFPDAKADPGILSWEMVYVSLNIQECHLVLKYYDDINKEYKIFDGFGHQFMSDVINKDSHGINRNILDKDGNGIGYYMSCIPYSIYKQERKIFDDEKRNNRIYNSPLCVNIEAPIFIVSSFQGNYKNEIQNDSKFVYFHQAINSINYAKMDNINYLKNINGTTISIHKNCLEIYDETKKIFRYVSIEEQYPHFSHIMSAFPINVDGKIVHKGELRKSIMLKIKNGTINDYTYPFEANGTTIIKDYVVAIKLLDRDAMKGFNGIKDGDYYNPACNENPIDEISAMQYCDGVDFRKDFKGHLIKPIACIYDRARVYSVMPFLGKDCDLFFDFEKSFKYEKCKKYLFGAIKGILMLHKLGLVHRDISLENICINEKNDTSLVIDLGTTKYYPTHPVTHISCYEPNRIVGKQVYYPFEYLYNGHIDNEYSHNSTKRPIKLPPLDVWCFGVMFYMYYTKNMPFNQNSPVSKYNWYSNCFNKNFDDVISLRNNKKLKDIMTPIEFDLLKRMLDCNPDTRITAEEIYNHKYFEHNKLEDLELYGSFL